MLGDGVKETDKAKVHFDLSRHKLPEMRNFFSSWNLRQHVIVGVVWIFQSRLAELVVIFTRNYDSLNSSVLFHCVFPSQQFVVANFVQLKLVAKNEWESVSSFTPRPNHVVSESRLFTWIEFRSTLLQFFLENVQSIVKIGDGTRWTGIELVIRLNWNFLKAF